MKAVYATVETSLTSIINMYIEQNLQTNYNLLKENNLDKVESFVNVYQKDSAELLSKLVVPWDDHAIIFNSKGEYLFCSDIINNMSFRTVLGKDIKDASSQGLDETSGEYMIDGEMWFYKAILFKPWDWYITISVPKSAIDSYTKGMLTKSLLVIFALSATISLLIISFFKFNIIGPLEILSKHINSFARDKKSFTTGIQQQNIVGNLARSIEVMSQSIEQYKDQLITLNAKLAADYEATHLELISNEAKYRKLYENMLNGVAYHKVIIEDGEPVDYIILSVNSAYEKHTGLKGADAVGKKVTEILPNIKEDEYDWIGVYGKVALTGEPISFEQYFAPLGKHFLVNAYQVEYGYFATMVQDITYTVIARDKLLEINKDLDKLVVEETNKRVLAEQFMLENKKFIDMGRMVSAIAHQWRQPLNALGLYIQDIEQANRHGELNEKYIRDMVQNSMALVSDMSGIIDEFMHFFSPKILAKDFSVYTVVNDTLNLISSKLTSHNIAYRIDCVCDDKKCRLVGTPVHDCIHNDLTIHGYEGEFKQVLLNLIHNSFDAIKEKQKTNKDFSPIIRIELEIHKDQVNICVIDNGIGIKQEILDNIFDPYFTTKDEGEGVGIGLHMCKSIVEKHMGGYLTARSNADETSFCIQLESKG